jgi:Holliday junction DNA helicase RuvA
VAAIRRQDVARLTAIPGIGKKTAERIGLELKDRLPVTLAATDQAAPAGSPTGQVRDDLASALLNLGYQRQASEKAIDAVMKASPDAGFEQLLRDVLRSLMKG